MQVLYRSFTYVPPKPGGPAGTAHRSTGKVYSDAPVNGAKMADDQGQQFGTVLADITAGPSMSSDVRLKPGAKALGWVVFEVPKASKAATVTFGMDSGFAEQIGEWKLS